VLEAVFILLEPLSPSRRIFIGSHSLPPSGLSFRSFNDSPPCRCLNHSTSMGGTRSKVEGEDRHDLEPEGMREDTRHKIYTGSGSRSSYPTSCLE
jgi:hypothetical protein